MYDTVKFHIRTLDKINATKLTAGAYNSYWLRNMKIKAFSTNDGYIIENSITVFAKGNNLENINRSEVKEAFSELSDTIGIDIERAKLTRLDIGLTLPMESAPSEYLNMLQYCTIQKAKKEPTISPTGIEGIRYINRHNTKTNGRITEKPFKEICFYDKGIEHINKHHSLSSADKELIANSHLLRIESKQYCSKAIQREFQSSLIVKDLYDNDFFNITAKGSLIDKYNQIQKAEKMNLDIIGLYRDSPKIEYQKNRYITIDGLIIGLLEAWSKDPNLISKAIANERNAIKEGVTSYSKGIAKINQFKALQTLLRQYSTAELISELDNKFYSALEQLQ